MQESPESVEVSRQLLRRERIPFAGEPRRIQMTQGEGRILPSWPATPSKVSMLVVVVVVVV